PPLTRKNVLAGHGFHFRVPSRPSPVALDVMFVPPRVGLFDESLTRSMTMRTPWGTLRVVSIEDLIALKRTRRQSDYEVISNLVRLRLEEEQAPARPLLRWAARTTFRAEDRVACLRDCGVRVSVASCREDIQREIARLQARDAAYWR